MNLVNRILAVVLSAGCLAAAAPGQGLKVDFSPVFQGDKTGPVRVALKNPGRGVKGQIRVNTADSTVLYPVELPTGSEKQVVVTPLGENYNPPQIQFEAGARVIARPADYPSQYLQNKSALIHDQPDAIRQISMAEPIKKISLGLFPTLAEDAPDRASGYDNYSSVWLAEGSNRLTDTQISALKIYVLQGGCLVFTGGASSSALRDPRWQDLIGAKAEGLTNVNAALLTGLRPSTFGRVNLSAPAWSTTQFQGLGGYKSLGEGRAIILLFSPFDQVFTNAGTASQITAKVHSLVPTRSDNDLFYSAGGFKRNEYSNYSQPSDPSEASVKKEGVFQYKPPPAEQLFAPVWIFALVLTPLAILVPRFLKRAELAWIFVPAAAVGAAVLAMSSQTTLRNSLQAQETTGIIAAQEGMDAAVAMLTTYLFFPRSGQFDLKLEPVERAELRGGSSLFMSGASTIYDVGMNIVPPITVRNLEFRTLMTRETVDGPSGWIAYKTDPAKGTVLITNKSPHVMKSVRIGSGAESGALRPGQSASVKLTSGQKNFDVISAVFDSQLLGPKVGKATSLITLKYRTKMSLK